MKTTMYVKQENNKIDNELLSKRITYGKIFILVLFCIGTLTMFFTRIYMKSIIDTTYAKDGRIELTHLNSNNKLTTLDGEWEFYPNQFIQEAFLNGSKIQVPGTFTKYIGKDHKGSRYGYGTYRLRFSVDASGDYGLKFAFVSSAYRVYLDKEEVMKNGSVSKFKKNEVANWTPRQFFFHADKGEHELVIHVSNYTCYNGGITKSVLFGNQDILVQYDIINAIKHAIMLGIILGIGFFLIIFNISIKNNILSTYLGIFCIFSFLLELVLDGSTIFYLYHDISVPLTIRIEYIAYIGQIIGLNHLVYEMFTDYYSKKLFRIIKDIDLIYLVLITITPVTGIIYEDFILVFILLGNCLVALFISILARRKYRKIATIFLIGGLTIFFCGVLQLLDMRYFIKVETIGNDFYILGLIIFMLCLSYILFYNIEQTFEKSTKAKKMEVAFLQAQIAPHFFFNVINNIYYLMDDNPEKAKKLLMNFSDFLRVKHKFDYRKTVYYTIREELELVKSFIEIENIRLNNQITLHISCEDDLLSTYILPLLIQPLVENVINHGFFGKPITVQLTISKENDLVRYVIQDNGKGMGKDRIFEVMHNDTNMEASTGIGLSNIKYRLQDCYQTNLQIESEINEGTKISFLLPVITERN